MGGQWKQRLPNLPVDRLDSIVSVLTSDMHLYCARDESPPQVSFTAREQGALEMQQYDLVVIALGVWDSERSDEWFRENFPKVAPMVACICGLESVKFVVWRLAPYSPMGPEFIRDAGSTVPANDRIFDYNEEVKRVIAAECPDKIIIADSNTALEPRTCGGRNGSPLQADTVYHLNGAARGVMLQQIMYAVECELGLP
jgi:hypothetical protein